MAMVGNHLYVTDIDRMAEIDIRTHKVIHFYPAQGAEFLNDAQAGNHGKIYVTDSKRGAIYILNNHQLKLWMIGPLFAGANGLAWRNGKLLVGVTGYLLQVDPKTKIVVKLIANQGGIDGLVPLGDGRYLVSNWAGKIQIISTHGKPVIVSNTTAEKINAADLGYIPQQNLVLIPTFFDNRVIAKKLTGL
jgi:sugar lactone lactonase YvrE